METVSKGDTLAKKQIKITVDTGKELSLSYLSGLQGDLKSITDDALAKLKASIKKHGFAFPMFVWENSDGEIKIIDGHMRLKALESFKEDGYAIPQIPVVMIPAKNEDEAKEKLLAAASLYGEFSQSGFDSFLESIGDFREKRIEDRIVIPTIELPKFEDKKTTTVSSHERKIPEYVDGEDEVPEVKTTNIKLGDVFELGDHRLMCGDSTSESDFEKLCDGKLALAWISDPPYGINHVEVSQEKGQSKGYKKIANDDLQDQALYDFIFKVIEVSKKHLSKGFAFYMWHAMKMQAYFSQAAAAGILFHRQIIWNKERFVFGRGHYHWKHELCLMGWLEGNEPPFYGERNQTTVWSVSRENDKIHPTQKPVELYVIPIMNHLKEGEFFLEPFGGSGSGIVAAEKTGRRCLCMEFEPIYVATIIERWQAFSGKKAVRINPDGSKVEWDVVKNVKNKKGA